MKRTLQTTIMVMLLLPLITFCGAEQTASESYYDRLKSLVTPGPGFRIRPNATERDVNLIEIEKGAAGVVFGASMDDVVAVWGKPNGIWIDSLVQIWTLQVGACRFGFLDNRLTTIAVSSATIEKAHLANGIGFESSYDEVKSAFGEPVEATDSQLSFATGSGYTIEFQFVRDRLASNKPRLILIEISCPHSGRPGERRLNWLRRH